MRFSQYCVAFAALAPLAAFAHPGGEHVTGFCAGLEHPFSGADHMLAMLAVGVWAAQLGGRAVWAIPIAFMASMGLAGGLGVSGIALPFVEQGVLLSVLVLGVLIAGALRLPVAAGMLVVSGFGVFHGYAHGAEMPSSATALFYGLGFMLATALLHAAGVAVGIVVQRSLSPALIRLAGCAISIGGLFLSVA